HLQTAEEYLQKQKFDKATDELKRVSELDAQNAEARELEGRVKQEEQLKRVQDHLQAAEGYLQKQKFDKATDELKHVYKLDPENTDAEGLEERIQQAQQEENRRRVETILQKAEEDFQNGKFQKALDEAAQVYSIDPEHAEAKAFQAEARKAINEEKEARRKAEEEAAREAENKKRVKKLLEQAQSGFLNGEYDKVLTDISRIYRIDPANSEAAELIEEIQKVKELEEKAAAEGVEITEKKKIKTRKRVSHRYRARIRRYILVAGITVVAAAAIAVAIRMETFFPGPPSLAVFPLTNESGNPREEYIANGLTAAFISDFGIIADLKTPGASTALSYKGERVNLAQVGRELRVSHILSGSARMSGDRLEVSIEVRDTIRGERVWTKEYSGSLTDLPRIREDVFSSITDLLGIDPPQGPKPFAAPWSNDPEAVSLYLQAMDLFRERTEQSLLYSIRLFDRALAEDSRFALAKAGKAYALALQYEREWEDNPAILETASKLARDVISSNANNVLAYRTLGSVYRQQRSYETAIEQIEKGLSINPRDVASYVELALTYGSQGDFKSGVETANKAVEIDPKDFEAHLAVALVHHLARNYKEAVSSYDRVISLRPGVLWELLGLYDGALLDVLSFERAQNLYVRYLDRSPNDYTVIYQLARSYQSAGKLNESLPHLNRVISLARQELSQNSRSARAHLYIGLAQTRLGKRTEGIDATERALALGKDDYTILYKAAGIYAMQKVTEESLKWFRSAVEKRYSFKGVLEHDLFNIRDEAEFFQISQSQ
ncbi:MAG: tetratricopeptide repeat protein, partial [Bacteroidota bacterium]